MTKKPKRTPQRPTIRDVAELAKVSLGTASRALNRAGRVSAAAIAAVNEAARHLGYEPDTVAQSMRTGTSGLIGLLVADIADPFSARIVSTIEAALQREGYALIVANTYNDPSRESSLIELFRRRRVDGLIVTGCGEERQDPLVTLRRHGIPVVALGRDLDDQTTGVNIDHYNGSLQATRYLLSLGHRRISLLTASDKRRPGRERVAGYRDAYIERGLEHDPKLIRVERSSMEFAFSEALALVSSPQRPTAFLCLGTRILAGALQGIRHSSLSIPEDLSIISVGDTDLARLFSPAVTTLAWDFEAVGRAVAELMLKRVTAGATEVEPERILITTHMILRESCGPVATTGTETGQPKATQRKSATTDPK